MKFITKFYLKYIIQKKTSSFFCC